MITTRRPTGHCPVCGSYVFAGIEWSDEMFFRYYARSRTPICPGCATILVAEPDGLRLPTECEVVDLHMTCDDIETIQAVILERLGFESRRVR